MMGGIVTRNMYSKAIAKNKRNCCILLELFHYWSGELQRRQKYLATARIQNLGPTASSYTDYAIPDPLYTDSNIYTLKMSNVQDRSNLGTSDGLLKLL